MMYYRISNDLTTKIVGSDHPQSWLFTKEYEKRVDNPNSIYALNEALIKKNNDQISYLTWMDLYYQAGLN